MHAPSKLAGGRAQHAPRVKGAKAPGSPVSSTGRLCHRQAALECFFQTELDLILRRLGVRTVILAQQPQTYSHHLLRCQRSGLQCGGAVRLHLLPDGGNPAGQPGGYGADGRDDYGYRGLCALWSRFSAPDLAAAIRTEILGGPEEGPPFASLTDGEAIFCCLLLISVCIQPVDSSFSCSAVIFLHKNDHL